MALYKSFLTSNNDICSDFSRKKRQKKQQKKKKKKNRKKHKKKHICSVFSLETPRYLQNPVQLCIYGGFYQHMPLQ